MYWLLFSLLFLPSLILIPVKVVGIKNFDKKKNYIFVSNHQSNFDAVILHFKFKKKIRFIAKQELWKGKEKSFFYDNLLDCIKVDRSKGLTLSATKNVYKILDEKKSLGIFPEGTRNVSHEDLPIKHGACLFSIKTKTPILPCYILNKQKLFKKNILLVGKPIEFDEFYDKKIDKEILNQASDILEKRLYELKNEYLNHIKEKKIVKNIKK